MEVPYWIYSGWLGIIGSRVVYELDHKNLILYLIPIQSILGKCRLYQLVTRGWSHTTWVTTFRGLLATAGRVLAIDAICGLSIRGHWDGPVICNATGRAVCASVVPHRERFHVSAAPKHHFWGHSPLHSDGSRPILVGSFSSAAFWAGACQVWGSASEQLWNWAGADKVPHARVGG